MSRRTERGLAVAGLVLVWACTSTGPAPRAVDLEQGISVLSRPLPGSLSALYRMRVARTGGMRLAVTAADGQGRLVVSKPLGGPVAMAAWQGSDARLFDLAGGCEADPAGAARLVGLGSLPLEEVPRILGGRLPRGVVEVLERRTGWLRVGGGRWSCRVRIAADPWRVTALQGPDGTSVTLSRHTASVPGRLRIDRPDGEWIELELVRLEWDRVADLPPLPELEPCGDRTLRAPS